MVPKGTSYNNCYFFLFFFASHGFDFDAIRNSIDEDFLDFLTLSTEMLYAEILTKFVVCVYEALWTMSGVAQPGGATPGKLCLGLCVLHVDAVVPVPAAAAEADDQAGSSSSSSRAVRVIAYPARDMGFQRALLRALVKNVLMTLVFPMCFIMYPQNRTSYDVATRTIVVEAAPGGGRPVWRTLQ